MHTLQLTALFKKKTPVRVLHVRATRDIIMTHNVSCHAIFAFIIYPYCTVVMVIVIVRYTYILVL